MHKSEKIRIGVDLGGTKTEIIALSICGKELLRYRVKSPRGDYPATIQNIVTLVQKAEHELGVSTSVGVATPGAISTKTGALKNSNSVWLNHRPLKQDLQQALQREVRLANDANCFALSEAIDGAAADGKIVFGVIVGTGTGGGIVVDQRLITGVNSIAGEWGHNPLPWPSEDEIPGPTCYCGKQGCIETYLSGPAMSNDYFRIAGTTVDARQIVSLADNGDGVAIEVIKRYEQRIAKALASVINVLDPDVIVLGGGMSNIKSLYDSVPKLWGEFAFSDHLDTKLVPPKYGDSSGVRGAAWLWD